MAVEIHTQQAHRHLTDGLATKFTSPRSWRPAGSEIS